MELSTDRLILRPIEEKDAVALHPLINDADVAAGMLSIPHPYPRDVLAPWITLVRKASERKERIELAIVLKQTGLPVGACSLSAISWVHQTAEIGYWLGRKYWGKGIMTEAVRCLIDYAFEDLDLERIEGRCFAHNRGSAKVLEKVGFEYEGCGRHEVKKGETHFDVLHFSILRSECPRGSEAGNPAQ